MLIYEKYEKFTHRHADLKKDRQTDRHTDRRTGTQTHTQTDRQTDRVTCKIFWILLYNGRVRKSDLSSHL